MAKKINPEINEFILSQVEVHPGGGGKLVVEKFGVSKATANNYLSRLVKEGVLESAGNNRSRKYSLKPLESLEITIPISPDSSEDVIWREHIAPLVGDLKENVRSICQYGFTEMVNNVIDHSESRTCSISIKKTAINVLIQVGDKGIGVFEKIRREFNLEDHHHAILELSKGKLTTDAERHSGEGIFFSSRMFDKFILASSDLMLGQKLGIDLLMDSPSKTKGTGVLMEIQINSKRTTQEIFDQYSEAEKGFSKTNVLLELGRYEGEELVSRSQAKRLLARAEDFSEVWLDFRNINTIGQAFADEVFRVFQNAHPHVHMIPVKTNPEVDRMIAHVLAGKESQNQLKLDLDK